MRLWLAENCGLHSKPRAAEVARNVIQQLAMRKSFSIYRGSQDGEHTSILWAR